VLGPGPGRSLALAAPCLRAWVATDRNTHRALQLLAECWPEEAPRRPLPYRSRRGWIKRDNWDAKVDQLIVDSSPGLRTRQVAIVVHANLSHIQVVNDIAAGHYNDLDPRIVRNMLEAAKIGLMAGWIGPLGSQSRSAPVVRARQDGDYDLSSMSLQELTRLEAKTDFETKVKYEERDRTT
jgi:hypothetical protein